MNDFPKILYLFFKKKIGLGRKSWAELCLKSGVEYATFIRVKAWMEENSLFEGIVDMGWGTLCAKTPRKSRPSFRVKK